MSPLVPSAPRVSPPRFVPDEARQAPRSREAAPASARREVLAPPSALPVYAPGASRLLERIPNRTTWLVAAAMILVVAGISSVALAIALGRQSGNPLGSGSQAIGTVHLTQIEIARALPGHKFTRDVVPPELADAAPLHDIFVVGAAPGLIGQATTSTSDLGGIVTFYVFADPAWAEAFYEKPPTAFGCGVCTSMDNPTPQPGVGDNATSYVLYRNKVGGDKSWIATTTYAVSGSVVVNGVYFPVNVGNESGPSPTDVAVATLYTKAALQLLNKISG